jgi:hypothetical protein
MPFGTASPEFQRLDHACATSVGGGPPCWDRILCPVMSQTGSGQSCVQAGGIFGSPMHVPQFRGIELARMGAVFASSSEL